MFAYNIFYDVNPHPSPLRIISSSLHTRWQRAMLRDVGDGDGATEFIQWVIDETDRRWKMRMHYNNEYGIAQAYNPMDFLN